mgnify:CR=1 FL=1|tara:strand:- start:8635 stop:10335 length:1701 start_codon:yes stop_codon:yes gene_type:complete
MAVAPLNKFLTIAIPVAPGEQTIYTAPTGTSAIVLYAQVSNVGIGQSYPTVTFTHRRTSVATRTAGNVRNNRLIKDGEIPPNDALILVDGRLVLERTAVVSDSIVLTGIQSGITTVNDAQYDNVSGVTTITTLSPHEFSVGNQVTMTGIAFTCPSTAGITSAIFPAPQAAFTITNVVAENGNVGISKTFVVNTGIVKGLPHTYRAALHRFVRSEVGSVDVIGGDTLKPTAADYDPISGIVSFTANYGTGLVNPGVTTAVTGTSYDPSTGVLTVQTQDVDSGWQTGDLVLFEEGALTFKCAKDSNTTEHSYPRVATGGAALGVGRITDPVFGKFIPVTRVNDNRFTCNVGAAGDNGQHAHTFQSGAGGKIKRHPANLAKSKVGLATEGFVFKCSQDNYLTEHKYPRTTDPSHWGSASDELGVNTPGAHTFNSGGSTLSNAVTVTSKNPTESRTITGTPTYTPSTGDLVITLDGDALTTADKIKIAKESLAFTCEKDAGSTVHKYPRITDPAYNKDLVITNVSGNSVTVNVGRVKEFSVHVGKSISGGLVGPLQMEFICSILENSTAQ